MILTPCAPATFPLLHSKLDTANAHRLSHHELFTSTHDRGLVLAILAKLHPQIAKTTLPVPLVFVILNLCLSLATGGNYPRIAFFCGYFSQCPWVRSLKEVLPGAGDDFLGLS